METEASFKIPTASVEPLAEPGSRIQETALKPLVQTVTYRGSGGVEFSSILLGNIRVNVLIRVESELGLS